MSFLDSALNTITGAASAVAETLEPDLIGLGEEIASQLRSRGEANIPVKSSAIQTLLYRRDHTLSIVFADGSRYAIPDFPAIELSRWLAASSIGAYWNANLRGKYG